METHFSLNAIWSRAVELVRDNFQLLAIIAGVFLLLPTMAAYLLVPDFQALIDPSADSEEVAARLEAEAAPLIAVGLFSLLFNFAGYGTLTALMGRSRPTVAAALKTGIAIVPSIIAASIVFLIAYAIGSIAIITPISLLATLGGAPFLAFFGVIAAIVLMVWLMARLSLTMPVLVLDDIRNPLKALLRSWRLTAAKQGAILAFWVVLGVIYLVLSLLFAGLFGVIGALMGSGSTAALVLLGLVNGVMAMAVGVLLCAIAVAMYGQLAGPSAARIEETFQ